KYIPYDDLKQCIKDKVPLRAVHAVNENTRNDSDKNERALVATTPEITTPSQDSSNVCSYYNLPLLPHHNIRECRGLQKNLPDGRVNDGTVLPANFAFRGGNTKTNHPYHNNSKNRNRGRNNNNNHVNAKRRNKQTKRGDHSKQDNCDQHHDHDRSRNRPLDSDSDIENEDHGNNRKVFHQ
ncbi:Hypothetical protein PHPALM_14037, partial [Phytophthora palmivora]